MNHLVIEVLIKILLGFWITKPISNRRRKRRRRRTTQCEIGFLEGMDFLGAIVRKLRKRKIARHTFRKIEI